MTPENLRSLALSFLEILAPKVGRAQFGRKMRPKNLSLKNENDPKT